MSEPPSTEIRILGNGSRLPPVLSVAVVFALLLALLAVNAIWGLTSPSDTVLSKWMRQTASLILWIAAGITVSGCVIVAGVVTRRRSLLAFGLMLVAYLFGVLVSRTIYEWLDPPSGIPFTRQADLALALWDRSFMLWPALLMVPVYAYFLHGKYPETFAWGEWLKRSVRDDVRYSLRWRWLAGLAVYVFAVIVPGTWLMQAAVNFEPIKSGTLFVFLGPVSVMCLFNGFTEELLFRGLFQPALCAALGRGPGVVLQALFFGFHHWGASPDLIAGLPMAITASALGILWGYSVIATRGMAWAICGHALADFAYFSANFV